MKPKLLTTLRVYTLPQLRADAIAGVTVAMVALPVPVVLVVH